VVHVRAEIATGESLRLAGRPEAALEQMSDVAERAATIDYPPVLSELQLELARALIGTGGYAEAATHVESAYWIAVDSGHDELARMAALWMGRLAIKLSSDFDGAQAWYRQAEAVVRRTGQDALAMSSVDHFRAMAYEDAAQYDLARKHCERALEPVPPDHPVLMAVLGTCARIASASADQDAAHRYHSRALEAARKTRGEEHPTYAQALVNLTMLEYQQGRVDEAIATIEQAIAIFERTVGPSAPQLAVALNNAGVFAEEKGDLERAVELYERGLAIDRATLGEENAEVASRLNNLGGALHRLGRVDDARRTFERTLEIFEKTLGTKHPRVGEALLALAVVARDEEAWDEALRLDRRALEIWEQALGHEHPHVAFPLLGLCQSLAGDGRAAEAVVHCLRALRIREAHDVGSAALGQARLFTGQALWLEGRDRGHARRLLAEGRAGLATGSPQRLAADQWLHEHGITL
jgi:tetratricopeptide (TPR) repeat protein